MKDLLNKLKCVLGGFKMHNVYNFECRDAAGNLKWKESIVNTTVNVGLNDILNKYFKGSAYTAAFYAGLKAAGTIAAADTMASHSGWTEVTSYSQSTRPVITLGSVASQSVDNSGSVAVFSINGTVTVAGGFVTTDSTKSGTSGTLFGAADFGASRSVASGDTINLTTTFTAASA